MSSKITINNLTNTSIFDDTPGEQVETFSVTDPDTTRGDHLVFSLSGTDAADFQVVASGSSYILELKSGVSLADSTPASLGLTLTVTDETSSNRVVSAYPAVSQTITVSTVVPTITVHAPANITINTDYPFLDVLPSTTFSDPEGSSHLTYTASLASGAALPKGLPLSPSLDAFVGEPLYANNTDGVYDVKVTATDSVTHKTASTTFDITVVPDPIATASIPNVSVNAGSAVSDTITTGFELVSGYNSSQLTQIESLYKISLIPPSGSVNPTAEFLNTDPATYSNTHYGLTLSASVVGASGQPTSWLTFNSSTDAFSGTPNAAADIGTYNLTVTATNGQTGVSAVDHFTLMVDGAIASVHTPLPFGNVAVGVPETMTETINNTGNAALTISSINFTGTNAADFSDASFSPATIAAGSSGNISVTFTPSAGVYGAQESANLLINDNAYGSPTQTVALTGTGLEAQAMLTQSSLGFGNVAVGVPEAMTEVINNTGNAALTISSVNLTGANAGDFSDNFTTPITIAAGSSGSISVTYTPSAGAYGAQESANLVISDNAYGSPSQTVALTGTGLEAQSMLTQSSLGFGNVAVGVPEAMTEVINNTGNAALTISSVNLTGANAGDFTDNFTTPLTIAAGSSGSISVTYTPSAGAYGAQESAGLVISDNAYGSPSQTVALTGTGLEAQAMPTQSSLGFGNVAVGVPETMTEVINNTGNADLTISSVGFNGTNAGDFTDNFTTPITIAAGTSGNISVTFTPSAGAYGAQESAGLVINDNAYGSPSQTVALSGTGTEAMASISSNPLTFGPQNIGTPVTLTETVMDTGNAPLTINSISFGGTNAGDFSDPTFTPITIAAGLTGTISVTFDPSLNASESGTLLINDNAFGSPQQSVNITGTGVEQSTFFYTEANAGGNNGLALSNSGNVYAWGFNGYGQLGNGTTTDSSTPIEVNSLSNIIAISGGLYTSVALDNSGNVYAWGDNGYGQQGNGTYNNSSTPVEVSSLTNVISISEGIEATLAVTSSGNVYAWGANGHGQLGLGYVSHLPPATPTEVIGVGDTGYLSNIIAVSEGEFTSLALDNSGNVYEWGVTGYVFIGSDGTTYTPTPFEVSPLSNIIAISQGYSTSLALSSSGNVYAWGDNSQGQLGNGTTTASYEVPIVVEGVGGVGTLNNIIAISEGIQSSLALSSDGHVYAWGWNFGGGLGNGTTNDSYTPTEVLGVGGSGYLSNIIAISDSTQGGFCLALSSNGNVYAWGSGDLGNGTTVSSYTPVLITGNAVSNGINIVNVVTEPGASGAPQAGGIGLQGANYAGVTINDVLDFTTPGSDYLVLKLDNPTFTTITGSATGAAPTAAQLDAANSTQQFATFTYNGTTNSTDIHFISGGDITLNGVDYTNFESFLPGHLMITHSAALI